MNQVIIFARKYTLGINDHVVLKIKKLKSFLY